MSSRRAIALLLLAFTIVVSCSEHKAIPEQELQKIITESLIRQSVINGTNSYRRGSNQVDTIDYHSEVLSKYGYTLEDFRYTIESMARRKSNPLDGILDAVSEDITRQALVAETRYKQAIEFEKAALNKYRDTIYRSDTILRKDFKDFKLEFTDSLVKGVYRISVTYKTMADYRYKQKALKYYFNDILINKPDVKTLWLSRSSGGRTVNVELKVTEKRRDSLVLWLEEVRSSHIKNRDLEKLGKDTAYIAKIEIVYTPEIEEAKQRYYASLMGDDYVFNRAHIPSIDTIDLPAPHKIIVKIDSSALKPKNEEIQWILER